MSIDRDSKIDDLVTRYPYLLDELQAVNPHFEKLRNPVMRKTMGKIATVSMAAQIAGMDADELAARLERAVAAREGMDAGSKQEILKGLIRELHEGAGVEAVKQRFKELVGGVDAGEIAAMEQALMDEGLPPEEIQRLCDVHVEVFKDSLEARDKPDVLPGHPIHFYMEENRVLEDVLAGLSLLVGRMGHPPSEERLASVKDDLLAALYEASGVRIHYERKENQLFPVLESHHFTGPSKVMWAIHDDIRADLKSALEKIEGGDAAGAAETVRRATQAMRDMIYKEEHILFPAAVEMISDGEWARMAEGDRAIGYAFGVGGAPGLHAEEPVIVPEREPLTDTGAFLRLSTGILTTAQVDLMLKHLPVDLTLVDEHDRVAYYSEGPHRIFPRSPAIIGREVRNCHPPKSVHVVNRILDAFKAGDKNEASFWISLGPKFVLIRYFAVRDGDGTYRGCLEVSQEISEIRELKGQNRLLDWEE